jgi:amino acid permease
VDFISLYLQIPLFLVLYGGRKLYRRSRLVDLKTADLTVDQYEEDEQTRAILDAEEAARQERFNGKNRWLWRLYYWLA